MKGQYLAVESVMTLGMGLAIAIGTVTGYTMYRSETMEKATPRQVKEVEGKLIEKIYSLKPADSGMVETSLPEEIGGKDYEISFDGGIRLLVGNRKYYTPLSDLEDEGYTFEGSTSGGEVKIFKSGDKYYIGGS